MKNVFGKCNSWIQRYVPKSGSHLDLAECLIHINVLECIFYNHYDQCIPHDDVLPFAGSL